MRKKIIFSLLLLMVVALVATQPEARAQVSVQLSTPGLSVNINGYLPAPPGVYILYDAGRPYYVEREQRIYIEKERPPVHYKKERDHHDHGRKHGHDR